MFQQLKAWLLRRYYRIISARSWRGHSSDIHWGGLSIPSPAGPIHGRLYNAGGGADKPLIVFFHGGGWVLGGLETHHPFCLELSDKTSCTVIAVDYRLAPEHVFPAAAEDCLAAVNWIAGHLNDFGPCNGKLVIAGDSAGGNLAASACLALNETVRAQVAGALLIYPAVDDYAAEHASYTEHAKSQPLTADLMRWFWDTYLGQLGKQAASSQGAFPLQADNIDHLPATLLVTAEADPLRDEGIAFAEKLRAAGVAVNYRHFEQAAHGFASSSGPNADHKALMSMIAGWIEAGLIAGKDTER
ncbi:alpha/beta hydrolase [Pseudohalioglobus lutimaris]|uniref:Alpha/beta hydrolase n=1 Tax=Pseudohalioglobus lutimaris TaxID=1737061 RepID=A0A2N5X5E6_9GAMM|nr:alpha/beta hydrolase [Pseudohalioglobus lutimaris]PLW69712.1 alpha/beta hydrolase [Pseudohalioglobus lutimaris]